MIRDPTPKEQKIFVCSDGRYSPQKFYRMLCTEEDCQEAYDKLSNLGKKGMEVYWTGKTDKERQEAPAIIAMNSPEANAKRTETMRNKSPEEKSRITQVGIDACYTPEARARAFASAQKHPNSFETIILEHLESNFPDQFDYNGGGEMGVKVGTNPPDFIHKTKKLAIEAHGTYYHLGQHGLDINDKTLIESQDTAKFKLKGWDLAIIWEDETEEVLVKRVKEVLK